MSKYMIETNTIVTKQREIFHSDFRNYKKAEQTAKLIADDAIEDLYHKYDIKREKIKVNYNYNDDNFNPLEIVITYEDDGNLTLRKFEKVIKIKEL